MKTLDLFSGIGGFSLGLERAGFKTAAFCETDKSSQRVLKKHWPDVPIYEDVRTLTHEKLTADGVTNIEVICGGFPCQDISLAGKGAGIKGERSGLWLEMARLISEIRPRYAIIENVSALRSRGLSRVLGDLAEVGYDAEWHCIPASAIGAPHERDRVWIVAYPSSIGRNGRSAQNESTGNQDKEGSSSTTQRPGQPLPHSDRERFKEQRLSISIQKELESAEYSSWWKTEPSVGGKPYGFPMWLYRHNGKGMSHGESKRAIQNLREMWNEDVEEAIWQEIGGLGRIQAAEVLFSFLRKHTRDSGLSREIMESKKALKDELRSVRFGLYAGSTSYRQRQQFSQKHPNVVCELSCKNASWNTWEDGLNRATNGLPRRMDRLRQLGNAVVPQIPELIGRAILRSRCNANKNTVV